MNWPTRLTTFHVSLIALAASLFANVEASAAANTAKIQQAITKAQNYILRQHLASPQGTIAALAYVKSGGDKKHPAVDQAVQFVLKKVEDGVYQPGDHFNYEAGVDIMLLEAVDVETYRPQMEAITKFLLGNQRPNGAWYYPRGIEPDSGDTSITQYALLGLWAAARADIDVPVEVWEKAARWHIAKQHEDGAFAYKPFDGKILPDPTSTTPRASMTAAGTSSLLIIRRVLFTDAEMDPKVRPPESKRRFGVLERFTDDKLGRKPASVTVPTLRPQEIDKAVAESTRWTAAHFIDKSAITEHYFFYYLYCIERVAALLDIDKLGKQDWYEEGSNEILKRQTPEGSWVDLSTPLASTAFGLMFLSKATTTIVTPKKQVNLLGGGLQAGGRGLPDNLGAVQMKEGTVAARKIVGAVDNLLIELERSADAKVEAVQAAVVDAVQLDRPEELIGQMGRLRKLASDSRVEVRRTALWALGRSGDISTAKLLIEGLADPDITVAREASLGLCILSRRPEGCGESIDPTDDSQMKLKEDATDQERKTRLDEWKSESKKKWLDWYQKYKPYDDRDDRSALKRLFK